jgi:hypothetical protein
MNLSLVSLIVQYREPVDNGNGKYTITYWLTLKVDNGYTVGVGQSQPVTIVLAMPSLDDAKQAASRLQANADRILKDMDIAEALGAFPTVIADLADYA